jgi:hypothetical protein
MPMDMNNMDMGGNNEMDMMGNDNMDNNMGDDMGDMNNDDESIDDPKKNIQRLAGKLSQALRTYNMEQEKPDTDLNKYVVGMIATQAAKDMTSDEKQEIVKKINKGETIEDNGEENIDNNAEDNEMPMEECKQNNVMDDEKDKKRFNKKSFDFKKNPFSSQR